MVTWAQQLRKEGRQEGVQEAKIEDKQEILIMQLSQKFEITEDDIRLIRETTDLGALGEALKIILTADTKEEVLGKSIKKK
jgi:hypothetical protein